MEDPIKVWELSKDKTGLPVDLCVIDINEDYQDDDYKVSVDDYPSRLIMQNYYDEKCPVCGGYMLEKGNKLVCADEKCGYVQVKPKEQKEQE